jgi:hypothetical protein
MAGGGVYAFVNATLTNSTVSNNTIGMNGGGVAAGVTVSLTNTTVAGNQAYYAGALTGYHVSLIFSTIANNTVRPQNYPLGGVFFQQSCSLVSTIISGNNGGQITGSPPVSGNHNLVGANSAGQPVSLPGDTINCSPNLAALADNGGRTKTLALGAGSCAIDAGPAFPAYSSDQRGRKFARRVGDFSDIGAFEAQTNERIFFDGFEP